MLTLELWNKCYKYDIYMYVKLSKMVSLKSLFVVDRKYIEENTSKKLKTGESTRNVARDLQIFQSWVAWFFKLQLSECCEP